MRVFGCRAFVHIPKDERAKLDAKTKECIYHSSPRYELGFRLWDPVNKKIVRNKDEVFYKDQTIQDIQQSKKPKTIMVHNSGGEIPQRNEQPDRTIQSHQMEQPNQIEQSQAMQGEQMETNQVEQEPQVRRSTRVR